MRIPYHRQKNLMQTRPAIRQRGISLIELMIGMVISLLLIAGMVSLFVANKQTYRYNDERG